MAVGAQRDNDQTGYGILCDEQAQTLFAQTVGKPVDNPPGVKLSACPLEILRLLLNN
jgi:hypothetical protein